tara:strand:+ start:446 stop:811 length:366 start_codon:yes stop_codon:yes gene_type:complete
MIEAKIIFGILSVVVFSSLLRVQYNNQLRLYEKIILILLFFISLIFISSPSLLDALAKILKIERGNDFLFYLYMLLSGWGLIRSHIRINKLTSSLNKISSQIAINSAITLKKKNKKIKNEK